MELQACAMCETPRPMDPSEEHDGEDELAAEDASKPARKALVLLGPHEEEEDLKDAEFRVPDIGRDGSAHS